IFSQTYFNVLYNNAATSNSSDITTITKITFTATNISFLMADASTPTKVLSTVSKIAFGNVNGLNPLPVELVSFTSKVNGSKVILHWSTATEVSNNGFDIEFKVNGSIGNWGKIGFVKGSGNSNSPKEYSYTDSPAQSTKISYRLKQIDADGKYEYSSIIEVALGIPAKYSLKQNYPNPFNPSTRIAYNLPANGLVTLKVFDILGREVASLVNENQKAGSYEVTFDGSRLASGVYICKMNSASFSSSIKMIMVK
ncbi:MAG: T9SS type A sorting domain-containing protein, partial [Bacteroidota bacterium]|nr:T9SS type A sorting domain-containing protein [Bacteroidota bacterium]